MTRRIYLDNNASTPLDQRVAREIGRALEVYGNPSSIHDEGRAARSLVDEARVSVAQLLNCDHRRIVFTSGGTESINLAISGYARANSGKGRHIITSSIEHSAVLNACRQLEREEFEVTYIKPAHDGVISVEAIDKAIRNDTALISIMMANNEIGTLQPVAEIAALAHEHGIAMHTDAVQALGKVPVDVQKLGVDLLSVSSHKIYGPKGAGALYIDSGCELLPLLRGGTHENGLRAGTESVPTIHGFGVAARLLVEEELPDLLPLRRRLEAGLSKYPVVIVCEQASRLPNTVNFYMPEWIGESLVMALDLEGFAVSNGSACASGIIEPSHVILALGYNREIAGSVVRVSFGKFNREEDVDSFLRMIHQFVKSEKSVS